MTVDPVVTPLSWGVEPLPEQERAAELLRDVTSLMLRVEGPDPALDALLAALETARDALTDVVPPGLRPRIGKYADGDGRVFIDHCRDMGAFNPMYPVYEIEVVGPEFARGQVNFPIAYEANAGCVNGGFLGVFFDQVVQHHNCDLGQSGATRDLNIGYRRPVPLLVDLEFTITREVDDRDVISHVELLRDGVVVCEADTRAARSTQRSVRPVCSPRRIR